MKGVRGIFGAIFIVAMIGLGAYNSIPSWKVAIEEQTLDYNGEQIFSQEATLEKSAKLRLILTETTDNDIMVYWLTPSDYDALMKDVTVDGLLTRLEKQTIFVGRQTPGEGVPFALEKGDYFICIQGIVVDPAVQYNTIFRIEELY